MKEGAVVVESILDNNETYEKLDPQNMLEAVEAFPSHCREAFKLASSIDLRGITLHQVRNVFILGMGGSGVSGDILQALYSSQIQVSISTLKAYEAPASLNESSLVFAVSYSGNTEETLSALDQALQRNAQIIAVTSGGRLRELADIHGFPCLQILSGLQPRAALGFLALPLITILERLWVNIERTDYSGLFEFLDKLNRQYNRDIPIEQNKAKQIAHELHGNMPVIYGCEGVSAVAAIRWKTQINENSKSPAYSQAFSELDHNEIVGWENLGGLSKQVAIIMLHEARMHPQNIRRLEITKSLISGNVGKIIDIHAGGTTKPEQLFSMIYLGDFVSVYLAFLYGSDPTPVVRIESLKKSLAE